MEQLSIHEVRQHDIIYRLGFALMSLSAWPGRKAATVLNVAIVLAVLIATLGSLARLNVLLNWGFNIPLFGTELEITGVAELQWHLFGIMVLLGGAYAVFEDRHIRVDFIYGHVPPKWQYVIDLVGDLLFLIPFCVLMIWLSQNFIRIAFISGEKSDYGGLIDRYLIKTVLPIGFFLLGTSAVGRVLINVSRIWQAWSPSGKGDQS